MISAEQQLEVNLQQTGLGSFKTAERVAGGSINQAFKVVLDSGEVVFVKQHPNPPDDFFEAEAHGLKAIGKVIPQAVPQVKAVSARCLVLSHHSASKKSDTGFSELGRLLAELHGKSMPHFGFERDNFCGLTPQPNPRCSDGHEFFAEQRLLYQTRLARDSGLLDDVACKQIEAICRRLPDLVPRQPAVLIHGDLWGGNVLFADSPILIDPACHYGWAEADLAMTTLFGGFNQSFYRAYEESSIVEAGWRDRASLYNLYHLLNHLNLFGGGYFPQVREVLKTYV